MKLSPVRKNFGAKAVLAAAALAASVGHAHAQSSDALIDKLVDKGILSEKEAQDLRDESDKDFTTAFQSKVGMPDWVTGYKLSGDFRGRFEQYASPNKNAGDHVRFRYRLRAGLTVSMFDNLEAGFRLGSGDPVSGYSTATPLSNSSTFGNDWTKKAVFIDTAYGKWTPINSGGWLASVTVGKMDNPFSFTPMVFDVDLTPEGAAVQSSWAVNDKHTLSLNGAAYVLDYESTSTANPFLWGGQFLWNAKWTPKFSTTAGVGGFNIVNPQQLTPVVPGASGSAGNVPFVNEGNTRVPFIPSFPVGSPTEYVLADNFTPVIADLSATYMLDTFPFYNGAFPITFTGEYMQNVSTTKNNTGFWVGAKLGKAGTKHTWDISYRYEYLESDAWYDQLVDDDNVAFVPGNEFLTSQPGYYGGTDIKGHLITFDYSFTDSLTLSLTCYINDLISMNNVQSTPLIPDSATSTAYHFMADMNWKF
jgi:hypothetical protein